MKRLIWAVIIIALIVGGFYFYQLMSNIGPGGIIDEPIACTEEAKICPDGSYVGRVPPSCEFAACPNVVKPTEPAASTTAVDTTGWKTYRNEQYGFEFNYPSSLEIAGGGEKSRFVSFDFNHKPAFGVYTFDNSEQLNSFFAEHQLMGVTSVDGEVAKQTIYKSEIDELVNDYVSKITFLVEGKNLGISFDQHPDRSMTDQVIAQILSTFKFTK